MTLKPFAETISFYRLHKKEIEKKDSRADVRIALLPSSTIAGLKETMAVHCHEMGLRPDIYVGKYKQTAQEILDPKSDLYNFKPHIIFILSNVRAALGETYLGPYAISQGTRKRWFERTLKETEKLIAVLKKSDAKIVISNLEVPTHSPLGILENKEELGLQKTVREINERLCDQYKKDVQVFIFDYEGFLSRIGKQNALDPKLYYLGDITLDPQYFPALTEQLMGYIRPLKALTKKCLVVDLDNTMWGGIIGEDGLGGIKLGPTPEGRPFWELQKYMLSLSERGVILAINSKNNLEDVREVFKKHPHQVLKEEHFASLQINWSDKVENMRRIAEEIGIGIDSIAFLDDNPAERALIRSALPEVSVIELPEDPARFLETLQRLTLFDAFSLSPEDKKRSEMYTTERKRQSLKKSSGSLEEYLRTLGTTITIRKASPDSIPRVAQLTQKTNQFNTTTRRRTEEEIRKLTSDKNTLILTVDVKDNFGESGLTGVAIVRLAKENWRIDSFLLSCRVIGRGAEDGLLSAIIKRAKRAKAKTIVGEFIPTPKNAPAKGFYKRCGFVLAESVGKTEMWEYSPIKNFEAPKTVTVKEQ
ncbi:hypothetical protein A3A39_02390 [Candidatus Kaiserbacteria bacterium RIFCSPLOWO2_01_FULL_54_13]|uniref:N-acetyltransferase domain-containing protein n=1 Tax=Candidatus Kaiserbacteria bacterium RIFCSPLOWO2_01_FULL_54_13 TaxID=1798512 RepID=A0A1F6F138_9BACT|nr:MAG: hypothetical protein A3A39_02390 [Candidatus Kaiserbacteria bacterium RIFCSPLOWO2_01_FULL_54_13]